MTGKKRQHGVALVMACLLVTLVTAFGSAMMVQTLTEHQVVRRYHDLALAFQLAEAGADQAIVNLRNGDDSAIVSTALMSGTYSADIQDLGGSLYKITPHGLIGQTQRDLEVVVSLSGGSVFRYALFGEDSVNLKKNSTTDSYDSSQGAYNANTAGQNGHVATNNTASASISIAKDSTVNGQVLVGPGMSDPDEAVSLSDPVTITANPQIASASETLTLPAVDTGGLSCSSSLTLPKHSTYTFTEANSPYCFNSLSADTGSVIAVSGNVTVYAGTVDFDKNLQVNTAGKPTQFLLNVYGTSDVVIDKEGTFVGAIYAPGLKVRLKKAVTLYGAVAAEDVEIDKELTLHCDADLVHYGSSTGSDVTVKSWREL